MSLITNNSIWTLFPYKEKIIGLSDPSWAYLYFKNYSIDLIHNVKVPLGINHLLNQFEEISLSDKITHPRVTHFFYELGFLLQNLDDKVCDDAPLAIDIEYHKINFNFQLENKKINWQLKSEYEVEESVYQKQFDKGKRHLLKGDCYQFNLTNQFIFSWEEKISPLSMVSHLWRDIKDRGAYASATYIPSLDNLYFSNSPECLFQIKEDRILSMPIKGTLKREENANVDELWLKLIECEKNESELFMITDLIRNDLSAIDKPVAKVEKLKEKLLVPGLIHQYSKISVKVNNKLKLMKVIRSLFPGGSITGAPKKNVMKILEDIETVQRGFYCGSTLINFRDSKVASINIRSAIINLTGKSLNYGAGGGITLQSCCADELKESKQKLNSFRKLVYK